MLIVSPAYGRDYRSQKDAREDWRAGKDFVVETFGPDMGRYVNIQDHPGKVMIRYARMTKVCQS